MSCSDMNEEDRTGKEFDFLIPASLLGVWWYLQVLRPFSLVRLL